MLSALRVLGILLLILISGPSAEAAFNFKFFWSPSSSCEIRVAKGAKIHNAHRQRNDGAMLAALMADAGRLKTLDAREVTNLASIVNASIFDGLQLQEELLQGADYMLARVNTMGGMRALAFSALRSLVVEAIQDHLRIHVADYQKAKEAEKVGKGFHLAHAVMTAVKNPITAAEGAEIYLQLLNPKFEEHQRLTNDLDEVYQAVNRRFLEETNLVYKETYARALALLSVAKGRLISVKLAQLESHLEASRLILPRLRRNSQIPTDTEEVLEKLIEFVKARKPSWGIEVARIYMQAADEVANQLFDVRIGQEAVTLSGDRSVLSRMDSSLSLTVAVERDLRVYAEALYRLSVIEESMSPPPSGTSVFIRFHQILADRGRDIQDGARNEEQVAAAIKSRLINAIVEDDPKAVTKILRELRVLQLDLVALGDVSGRSFADFSDWLRRPKIAALLR
jgi:hypothetical protein